jgi:hypothetical protein
LPMSMPVVATVKFDLLGMAVLLCFWQPHPCLFRFSRPFVRDGQMTL